MYFHVNEDKLSLKPDLLLIPEIYQHTRLYSDLYNARTTLYTTSEKKNPKAVQRNSTNLGLRALFILHRISQWPSSKTIYITQWQPISDENESPSPSSYQDVVKSALSFPMWAVSAEDHVHDSLLSLITWGQRDRVGRWVRRSVSQQPSLDHRSHAQNDSQWEYQTQLEMLI